MKNCKCGTSMIAKILVIVGGINWGFVGVGMLMNSMSNWNIVNILLGTMPMIEAIVYVLVGVSAVVMIFGCKGKKCMEGCATCEMGPKESSNM